MSHLPEMHDIEDRLLKCYILLDFAAFDGKYNKLSELLTKSLVPGQSNLE
jgi:hypothetical protein